MYILKRNIIANFHRKIVCLLKKDIFFNNWFSKTPPKNFFLCTSLVYRITYKLSLIQYCLIIILNTNDDFGETEKTLVRYCLIFILFNHQTIKPSIIVIIKIYIYESTCMVRYSCRHRSVAIYSDDSESEVGMVEVHRCASIKYISIWDLEHLTFWNWKCTVT